MQKKNKKNLVNRVGKLENRVSDLEKERPKKIDKANFLRVLNIINLRRQYQLINKIERTEK
jgi:hypothetical protein